MSYAIVSMKNKKFLDKVEVSEIYNELNVKIPALKEKNQKKYAQKIVKILKKYKVSRLVLSNDLKKFADFKNIIMQNNHDIVTGEKLYKVLLKSILQDVSKSMHFEMAKMNVAMLMDEANADNIELIKRIAEEVKSLTLVTNNAYRFEQIVEELLKSQGIVVQLVNQKQGNLKRKHVIMNIDFANTVLEKMNFPLECLVITNSMNRVNMKKSFNGIVIRDIDIYLGNPVESFRNIELCEAYIYQTMKRIKENEFRFQHSEYKINGYIGNNGKIEQEDFERLGRCFLRNKKQKNQK